ncbi:hypothetical protein AABB02_33720 [Streptomyces rimosus]|uniref:DUF6197 family protein n=1 Tax=Streptomyces rimosus TaxID=1927 RepID=UPI0031DC96A2
MTTVPPDTGTPDFRRIAVVLDGAADQLDRYGWFQGSNWDGEQADRGTPRSEARQCAMGAITTAVCGDPSAETLPDATAFALWNAAIDAVEDHTRGIGAGNLTAWNDAEGRTHAEVTSVLRAAARAVREGGPTGDAC